MDSSSLGSDTNDRSSQASSSESDSVSNDIVGTRKHRRHVRRSNYLQGKCRKVYKLNEALDQSLNDSDISLNGVC